MFLPTFFNGNFEILVADLATEMRFLGFNEESIKRFIDKVVNIDDYYTLSDMINRYKSANDLYGGSEE